MSTYIVAQNPEVLVQLLRENERRGLNPSVYTTPANAFNTLAVDFDAETNEQAQFSTKSLPRPNKNPENEAALSDQESVDNCLKSLSCANFSEIPIDIEADLDKDATNSTNSLITPQNSPRALQGASSLEFDEVDARSDSAQV